MLWAASFVMGAGVVTLAPRVDEFLGEVGVLRRSVAQR